MSEGNLLKNSRFKGYLKIILFKVLLIGLGLIIWKIVKGVDLFYLVPYEVRKLPLYIKIISFLFAYILSLWVHEIFHVLAYKLNKINIRAMLVFFICLIKDRGKWKFQFKVHPFLMGGLVIPDLPSINDEETYKQLRKISSRVAIAGPIGTIVLYVLVSIFAIQAYLNDNLSLSLSLVALFHIHLTIICAIILVTSFIKHEFFLGDFCQYRIFKKDDRLSAVLLYRELQAASNYIQVRSNSYYLLNKIDTYLQDEYKLKSTSSYTLEIIENELCLYLSENTALKEIVLSYIKFLSENEDTLLFNAKDSETSKILLFRIINFLALDIEKKQQAKILFNKLVSTIIHRNRIMTYYIKQSEHLLEIKDNEEFLKSRKNIKTSSMWPIYSLFPSYYEEEVKICRL